MSLHQRWPDAPSSPPRVPARPGPGPTSRLYLRYAVAWLGMAALAPANGTLRELVLRHWLSDLHARQLSSASLVAVLFGYVWFLQRRWPIPGLRAAAVIGAAWATGAALFDFGFGLLEGKSVSVLLADYNLAEGRTWGVVVVATAGVMPLVRWLQHCE